MLPDSTVKILFVSNTFPIPSRNGVELFLAGAMKHLAQRHEVSFALVKDRTTHINKEESRIQDTSLRLKNVFTIIPYRPHPLKAALAELFLVHPFAFALKYDKKELRSIFAENFFDVIWASPQGMETFCRAFSRVTDSQPVTILGIHDAGYYSYFEMALQFLSGRVSWSGFKAVFRCPLMPFHEKKYLGRVDGVQVQTPREKRRLERLLDKKSKIRIIVAHSGILEDLLALPYTGSDIKRVLYITSLRGVRGSQARWFLQRVWPRVVHLCKDATLHIVGHKASGRLATFIDSLPGVCQRGFVPMLTDVFSDMTLSVAPIRQTKGVVTKILDSMAAGVPVVALEGALRTIQGFENGIHGVETRNAEEMAENIANLLVDKQRLEQISGSARSLVAERFRWENTIENIEEALFDLLHLRDR